MIDLDAITARCEAAAPGPWTVDRGNGYRILGDGGNGFVLAQTLYPGTSLTDDLTNAEFIAHARTDVPALVAEVERLRASLRFFADPRVDL